MKKHLEAGEEVIADGGHPDERRAEVSNFASLARARREAVNRRFKQLHCLSNRFRHSISMR